MIDKRKKVKWNDRVKGSSWVKLFNRSEAFSRERRIHVFRLTIRYVYISIYIYIHSFDYRLVNFIYL